MTDRLTLATARDALDAVLEALTIPHPATEGDREKQREILAARAMHARIMLEGIQAGGDPGFHVRYLRDRLAACPAEGYRTWNEAVAETHRRRQARRKETLNDH